METSHGSALWRGHTWKVRVEVVANLRVTGSGQDAEDDTRMGLGASP
jgi:hypothetical protein